MAGPRSVSRSVNSARSASAAPSRASRRSTNASTSGRASNSGASKRKAAASGDKLRQAVEKSKGEPLVPRDCAADAEYHAQAFPFQDIMALTIPILSTGVLPSGAEAPLTPSDEMLADMRRNDGSVGLDFSILLTVLSYVAINLMVASTVSADVFDCVRTSAGDMDRDEEIGITVGAAMAPTHEDAVRWVRSGSYPPLTGSRAQEQAEGGAGGAAAEAAAAEKYMRQADAIKFMQGASVSVIVEYFYATPADVRKATNKAYEDREEGGRGGSTAPPEAPEEEAGAEAATTAAAEKDVDEEALTQEARANFEALGFFGEDLEEAVQKYVAHKRSERRRITRGAAKNVQRHCRDPYDSDSDDDDDGSGIVTGDGDGESDLKPLYWSLQPPKDLTGDEKADIATKTVEDHLSEANEALKRVRAVGSFMSSINMQARVNKTRMPISSDTAIEYSDVVEQCKQRVETLEQMAADSASACDTPLRGITPHTGTFAEEVTGVTIYLLNNTGMDVSDIVATLLTEHATERHSRTSSLVSDKLQAARQDTLADNGNTRTRNLALIREARAFSDNSIFGDMGISSANRQRGGGRGRSGGGGGGRDSNKPANGARTAAAIRAASERARKREGDYAAGTIDIINWASVSGRYSNFDSDALLAHRGPRELMGLLFNNSVLDPRAVFSPKNALRHRYGLCAPSQSYKRFTATGGRSLLLGGTGARTSMGCGYIYFTMPVTCVSPAEIGRESLMMSLAIPCSKAICPPRVVRAAITVEENYSLGVTAGSAHNGSNRTGTRTQDPAPAFGEAGLLLGDPTECSSVESASEIGACVDKVRIAVHNCMRNGLLSQRASDAIMVGTRRWAASTMSTLMTPRNLRNSPGLRCAFYALREGVLAVNAPPVRDRLTPPGELEEAEDFAAATMLDFDRALFQSAPYMLAHLFNNLHTAFEPGLEIRNHVALQGKPGAGKSQIITQLINLCLPSERINGEVVSVVNKLGGSGWSQQMFNSSGIMLSFALVFIEEMDPRHMEANLTTIKKFTSSEEDSRWSAHRHHVTGKGSVNCNVGRFRFNLMYGANAALTASMPPALKERIPTIHAPENNDIDGTNMHIARQEVLANKPSYVEYKRIFTAVGHCTQGFFIILYQLQLAGAVPKAEVTIASLILNGVSSILRASSTVMLKKRQRQYISRLASIMAARRLLIEYWMRPGAPFEGCAILPERIAEVGMMHGIVPNVVDVVSAIGFYGTIVSSVASDEICAGILRYVISQIKSCIAVASSPLAAHAHSAPSDYADFTSGNLQDDDDGDFLDTAALEAAVAEAEEATSNARLHMSNAGPAACLLGAGTAQLAGIVRELPRPAASVPPPPPSQGTASAPPQHAGVSPEAVAKRRRTMTVFSVISAICPLRRGQSWPKNLDMITLAKIQQLFDTSYFLLPCTEDMAFTIVAKAKEEKKRFFDERMARDTAVDAEEGDGDSLHASETETLSPVSAFGLYAPRRNFNTTQMPTEQGVSTWMLDILRHGSSVGAVHSLLMDEEAVDLNGSIMEIFTVREGDENVEAPIAYKPVNRKDYVAVRISHVLGHESVFTSITHALQAFLNNTSCAPRLVTFGASARGAVRLLPVGSGYRPGAQTKEDLDPNDPDGNRPCKILNIYTDHCKKVTEKLKDDMWDDDEYDDGYDDDDDTDADAESAAPPADDDDFNFALPDLSDQISINSAIDPKVVANLRKGAVATEPLQHSGEPRYDYIYDDDGNDEDEDRALYDDESSLAEAIHTHNRIVENRKKTRRPSPGDRHSDETSSRSSSSSSSHVHGRKKTHSHIRITSFDDLHHDLCGLAGISSDMPVTNADVAIAMEFGGDWMAGTRSPAATAAYRIFGDVTRAPIPRNAVAHNSHHVQASALEAMGEFDIRVKNTVGKARSPVVDTAANAPFWRSVFNVDFTTYMATVRNTGDGAVGRARLREIIARSEAPKDSPYAPCLAERPVYPRDFIAAAYADRLQAVEEEKELLNKMRLTPAAAAMTASRATRSPRGRRPPSPSLSASPSASPAKTNRAQASFAASPASPDKFYASDSNAATEYATSPGSTSPALHPRPVPSGVPYVPHGYADDYDDFDDDEDESSNSSCATSCAPAPDNRGRSQSRKRARSRPGAAGIGVAQSLPRHKRRALSPARQHQPTPQQQRNPFTAGLAGCEPGSPSTSPAPPASRSRSTDGAMIVERTRAHVSSSGAAARVRSPSHSRRAHSRRARSEKGSALRVAPALAESNTAPLRHIVKRPVSRSRRRKSNTGAHASYSSSSSSSPSRPKSKLRASASPSPRGASKNGRSGGESNSESFRTAFI